MRVKKGYFKKCKFCDKQAKRQITNGKNHGYHITCGSKDCIAKGKQSKKYLETRFNKKERLCEKCGEKYLGTYTQKWCQICVPNGQARLIMKRYALNWYEYLDLIKTTGSLCPVCLKRKAKFVDHDHNTGKVRGFICGHCNTALHLIEDEEALCRALKYLKGGILVGLSVI